MKVLKPGRQQRGWSIEHSCTGDGNDDGGCGALLLVEQPDLFKTYQGSDVCITFKCSECGVLTDLDDLNHPPGDIITHQIPTRSDWENQQARKNAYIGIPAR